jgi:hypothetical protein
MNTNTATIARQIAENHRAWTTLEHSKIDKRTRAYRQESARLSMALHILTHRYADESGMDHAAVLRKFDLI